jgi:hypothetical protein
MPKKEKGGWLHQKNEVIKRYKFTMAYENSYAEDYVTEKIYGPLCVG